MLRKLLPVLLALIGTGAGVGAGLFLMPAQEPVKAEETDPHAEPKEEESHAKADTHEKDDPSASASEYVKLNNQFVIPIMGKERVEALVVASLSVEVSTGGSATVYQKEPKLRDVFLQVLFDHANIGGFDGPFTAGDRMDILRSALFDAARSVLGAEVKDVLITEIARQDSA
ncbi:flagellar basal body-associated protein FliL [Antarctobacter jejuensis]|uniref:flagellar basal body-associated protein FliL n=1 Tax=Antarctobacter jejuensis TaxID=1439938 RepID=UPI003FD0C838